MKYSHAQITYHWISFCLILLMAATGVAYGQDWGGDRVINVHQIAGQILIAVTLARLGTRILRRTPAQYRTRTWD